MRIIASNETFKTISELKNTFFKSAPTWEYDGFIHGCYVFKNKYGRIKLFTHNSLLLAAAIKELINNNMRHTSTKFKNDWYVAHIG